MCVFNVIDVNCENAAREQIRQCVYTKRHVAPGPLNLKNVPHPPANMQTQTYIYIYK